MQSFLLLFFVFQISKCFVRFIHTNKMKSCLREMHTCYFPEDDKNRHRPNYKNIIKEIEPPLYTLIWYDCESCKKLLQDMEDLRLKNVYINGGEYFYDIEDVDSKFNTPLLYKEDVFIGDNLFDIYQEIYREM